MDLWIRSQRKERLCKMYNFVIREANKQGYYAVAENRNKNTIEYGIYKTKERALEVLDEIQDMLLGGDFTPKEEDMILICGSARVYEMPEE